MDILPTQATQTGQSRPCLEGRASGCNYFNKILIILRDIKQYIVNSLNAWSYRRALSDYNIRHVLEEREGVNTALGNGTFANVERYQATISEYGSASSELRTQAIAYKTAKREGSGSTLQDEEEAKYQLNQEKKVLSELNNPNIIKPSAPNGVGLEAKYQTTFTVATFSEEKKEELNALETEFSNTYQGETPDFDFDIITKLTEKPSGISLPLADSTLIEKLETLSNQEKDQCIRAMVSALKSMHDSGYVHLDLKPENILKIDDRWCIADCGTALHDSQIYRDSILPTCISRLMDKARSVDKRQLPLLTVRPHSSPGEFMIYLGTYTYMSPQMYARYEYFTPPLFEIFPGNRQKSLLDSMMLKSNTCPQVQTDGRSADTYSLGCVIFKILTGKLASPAAHRNRYYGPSAKTPERFQEFVNTILKQHKEQLGQYYGIVEGLLKSDISERMTVATALEKLSKIPQPTKEYSSQGDLGR